MKAKSNDHYQIEPACRAVGQSSQPNRAFRVGARRCGRAAHRLARVKQPRKATKILPKIDATSSRNRPTSTSVPSRAPQGAPETSQERLAIPSGRPGRSPGAPRSRLGASRDANRVAQGRPGARRTDQLHYQAASRIENFEFCPRVLLEKLRRCDLSSHFVVFRRFRKTCESSEVPHLSAKTEVWPFALRVESLARCNLEKPRKSTRKSTRNRRKSRLGASRAPFSVDFCRSERLGRATWSDSKRQSRAKGVDRGRSRRPKSLELAGTPKLVAIVEQFRCRYTYMYINNNVGEKSL